MSKKQINEGIIDKFIDSLFNSYKRGLDKQFAKTAAQKNPELAKKINNFNRDMDDLVNHLKKIQKK